MPLPPKISKVKKNRKLNKLRSNKPHCLQSHKKQYYNPDPIIHLVSKVNEAHILIDDMECLALVDLGVQISTFHN